MKPLLVKETAEKMVVPRVDVGVCDSQLEQAMLLYQERLYKAAYQCLRSHDPVEDILQVTWIKLYDYLIRSGQLPALLEALYPWLWVVAPIAEGSWLLEPRIKAFEHPDTIVIRREIREAVCQALSSLPQKQRDVCALYFFYGLRLSDIAVQLQCNLNTIKSYLYRDGVPLLRTVLEDWGVQIEDLNFWTGHKESTLEQYESGVYDGGDRSGT